MCFIDDGRNVKEREKNKYVIPKKLTNRVHQIGQKVGDKIKCRGDDMY